MPVDAKRPLVGSYSSAVAKALHAPPVGVPRPHDPFGPLPPVTKTWPLEMSVAWCAALASAIVPEGVKEPVAGSNRSEEAEPEVVLLGSPPVTKTFPLGKSVDVG